MSFADGFWEWNIQGIGWKSVPCFYFPWGLGFDHEWQLLNKKELRKLVAKAEIKGYSLVPVEVYFKNGWAKIKLAVAKGKHLFDKRESLKKRDLNRDMEQHFKNNIRF